MSNASAFLDKAMAAHEGAPPDWVMELARFADREGLGGAAARIEYSKAAVSTIINNKYNAGDLSRVETMVRGALMAEKVDCPVLNLIGRDHCLEEQEQGQRATNSMRAQLRHACRGTQTGTPCPHYRKGGRDGH